MIEALVTWLLGAMAIATAGLAFVSAHRLRRAIAAGEGWSAYLRLLLAILLHASGVLLASVGRLTDALLTSLLGFALLLSSKQLMLWPDDRLSRRVFAVQLAGIAAWTLILLL